MLAEDVAVAYKDVAEVVEVFVSRGLSQVAGSGQLGPSRGSGGASTPRVLQEAEQVRLG